MHLYILAHPEVFGEFQPYQLPKIIVNCIPKTRIDYHCRNCHYFRVDLDKADKNWVNEENSHTHTHKQNTTAFEILWDSLKRRNETNTVNSCKEYAREKQYNVFLFFCQRKTPLENLKALSTMTFALQWQCTHFIWRNRTLWRWLWSYFSHRFFHSALISDSKI